MTDNIDHINNLFATLKQKSGDVAYVGHINSWMSRKNVTFAELNFTKEEFETVVRQQLIAYINNLFATLKQKSGDVAYVRHINSWMSRKNVTFAELNFTKEEFEAAQMEPAKA